MELFGSAMMSLLATDFKGNLSQKEQKFRITVKQSLDFFEKSNFFYQNRALEAIFAILQPLPMTNVILLTTKTLKQIVKDSVKRKSIFCLKNSFLAIIGQNHLVQS